MAGIIINDPAAFDIIAEDPADEWEISEWLELMADAHPGGPALFGAQQQSASVVIRLEATRPGGLPGRIRSCVRQILGYSVADNTEYILTRPAVPIQHPWFPWLWADSVSVLPTGPLGNPDFPAPSGTDHTYPKLESAVLTYEEALTADQSRYGPRYTGNYGSAVVTVQFRHYPWVVLADDDEAWVWSTPSEEWRRMCSMVRMTPKLDLIASEGTETGKFYFAETNVADGNTGPTAGPSGTPFNGAVYVRKSQTGFTVCWKCVEEQYLIGEYPADYSDRLIMPNIERFDRYIGTVNSAEIWGQPAGTLLFAGYETVRYPQPIRTSTSFGLLAHDVYFTFDKTDPPRPASVQDSAGADIADEDRKRGHLVFPYRPNESQHWFTATAGSVTTRGKYTGRFALEELDHRHLFRHHKDPMYPLP